METKVVSPTEQARFVKAVREMRKAQTAYARTKMDGTLRWSKQAESEVDSLLEALYSEQDRLDL